MAGWNGLEMTDDDDLTLAVGEGSIDAVGGGRMPGCMAPGGGGKMGGGMLRKKLSGMSPGLGMIEPPVVVVDADGGGGKGGVTAPRNDGLLDASSTPPSCAAV